MKTRVFGELSPLRPRGAVPLRALMALALVGFLALPQVAQAAGKYKKSGGEVKVKAKRTKITSVKKEQRKRAAAVRNKELKPTLFAEQFREKAQDKVAKLTDAAIATLKRLIKVTDENDPEYPDYFFRLAEHYREKQTQYMFRARELDEKIYQAKTAGAKEGYKARQKKFEKAEKAWMLQGIKMYLHIAQKGKFAKYARMDEVLFNLGDMLNKANRLDKARVFFGRLIRNYPQSKYIPDAYLSFAEFYFNDGRVEEALKLYQQVGKYPSSPIYGYAIYKQGWCWLNLKDPRRALEKFVKVIKQSGKWGGTKKSKIILVKEAKKDSVRAFAHVGSPQRAWEFFQRIGGKFAPRMLEMLANLYYDQGKFLDSVLVFRKMISLDPKNPKLCSWEYSVMKGILSGKDKKAQLVEAKRMAAIYHAIKGRGDIRKTQKVECKDNATGVLRELATTWHSEAQKTQNMETYDLAQHLYKAYLDNFPKEKDAYTMTYYYAELLYKLERWEPAAGIYTQVVKMSPKGKYLKEAAYAAVISWKNALNVQEETKDVSKKSRKKKKRGRKRRGKKAKVVEDEVIVKKPIPEKELKMISAFDTYIKYVPDAPELVPIIYRKARIYYNYNHYDEAVKVFALIITKHSSHELASYAANLLLDSLNITKQFDKLNKWVNRMLRNKDLAQGDMLTQLRKLKRGSQRKAAEQLQKQGYYKECGERYAAIANEYQEDPRWPEVLYNAALCFEAAKLIGLSISIRNTLIKVKPGHPLSQKAMFMIGANYHALAWYSRASEYYERFATKYPGEKEAPEALQNAIVFRLGAGKYDKALENSRLFIKNYGPRRKYASRTAAVYYSMGAIYENQGQTARVIQHYNTYLKKWGRHGGLDKQITAHVKLGELHWSKSCPISTTNGACIKVKRVRSKRKIKKRKGKRKKKGIEVRTQCGPETKQRVTVVKRNAKAKKALSHFGKALKIYGKASKKKSFKGATKEDQARRKLAMDYAAGAARFYQAEKMFEKFLEVKFPKNLDFSEGKTKAQKKKVEKSKKAFAKYLESKGNQLGQTRDVYADVIKLKVAHWAIAASARIGQLFQNFADALYTAPVPKPPLDMFFKQLKAQGVPKRLVPKHVQEDFVMNFTDTYCDTLEDKAGPLEAKALQGLETCLSKSTELSWYNSWSKLCEKELNQIKPAEYPLAAEIRAKPGYVSFKTDRAKPITEIK